MERKKKKIELFQVSETRMC